MATYCGESRFGWCNGHYGEGLQHSYPTRWTLVVRRNHLKWSLFRSKGRAVHRICDDYLRILKIGIQLGKRIQHAITVSRLSQNVRRHRRTTELLVLVRLLCGVILGRQ